MLMQCNTGIGAAYGTAKSGIGIAGVGTFRGDLIMKVRYHSFPIHPLCAKLETAYRTG